MPPLPPNEFGGYNIGQPYGLNTPSLLRNLMETRFLSALILLISLYACHSKTNEREMVGVELMSSSTTKARHDNHHKNPFDTIRVDYQASKQLLDILQLLPDSVMVHWEWPQKKRIHYVRCIQRDGYVVDSIEYYMNNLTLDSTHLSLGVVDGGWELNIYKALDGSVIAITNCMATGGNSLRYFEFRDGQIKSKTAVELFNNPLENLWTKSNKCRKYMDLAIPLWDFDFSPSQITMDGSWSLEQKQDSSCVDGNALTYKFNPAEKKFDLERFYWKEKKSTISASQHTQKSNKR